jgi:5-methylcytosine-specific restriction enzyme A
VGSGWTTTGTPTKRITGRKLQRLRVALFARAPWCVLCEKFGRRTRATIRDHIRPLAEGGADDETNAQGLCLDCSDRKTEEEAQRGVRRSEMTDRFRKSATPRGHVGRFVPRRPRDL